MNEFIKTPLWQEIKRIMKEAIKDDITSIKTDGKTADMIALDVKSMELANKKFLKAIMAVERRGKIDASNKSFK